MSVVSLARTASVTSLAQRAVRGEPLPVGGGGEQDVELALRDERAHRVEIRVARAVAPGPVARPAPSDGPAAVTPNAMSASLASAITKSSGT